VWTLAPLRAIQDSSSSAAASSSDSNGGRAGAGTLVGAAEGAAGLLLFYADMVFSRGLHVAYYLSLGSHAFVTLDKILLSLDTCLWKGNQVL
jgi:hypothetical protein